MRQTFGILLALVLLGGCTIPRAADDDPDGAEPAEQRVTVADGSLSIEVPTGWETVDELPDGVAFAATEVDDENQQLIVTTFDSAGAAEERVLEAAVSIAGQGGVCQRLVDDTTFGDPYLVFDCPFTEPMVIRKVLVSVVDGEQSAMVLAQLDGATLDDTADVLTPFLEGFVWE